MKRPIALSLILVSTLVATSCRKTESLEQFDAAGSTNTGVGTIRGHVRLVGTAPENAAIRMRADPMCDKMAGGAPAVQNTVVVGADGGLANVLVQLQGSFPASNAPTQPVIVDQRVCVYAPRVVGIQIGQPLRVMNSDPGLHNVRGTSSGRDGFNVGQPVAGMVNEFRLKEEGILRLQCDVHTWMVAFVGVVSHPYFAVTSSGGAFEIHDVPAGTQTIQAWHELYGRLTTTARVDAGGIADVTFTYSGDEKQPSRP